MTVAPSFAQADHPAPMPPHSRHWSLRYGLPVVGLLLLTALYLLVMALTVDISRPDEGFTPDERDRIYIGIHLGLLLITLLVGFGIGQWLNGIGIALGVFFFAVMVTVMIGAQFGSYTLACDGDQNDIIRHWTC